MIKKEKLDKERQAKSKASIRREVIKRRVSIDKTEYRKAIEKTNKTKNWFFEKKH